MGKTIEDVCREVDVGKSKSEQSLPKLINLFMF